MVKNNIFLYAYQLMTLKWPLASYGAYRKCCYICGTMEPIASHHVKTWLAFALQHKDCCSEINNTKWFNDSFVQPLDKYNEHMIIYNKGFKSCWYWCMSHGDKSIDDIWPLCCSSNRCMGNVPFNQSAVQVISTSLKYFHAYYGFLRCGWHMIVCTTSYMILVWFKPEYMWNVGLHKTKWIQKCEYGISI
jgi:hypothetical protein